MSTKVLWFSRHDMTPDQRAALGDSEITQIDKTIKHASEVADEISQCDVLAVVAPVELQKEFLEPAGNKPVITAVNDRILVPTENGESKVQFSFVKWEQVKKIDIVKEDFDIGKYEKDREEKENSFFSEPSEEDLEAFRHEEEQGDTYEMVSGDRLEDLEDEHEAAAPEVADHEAGTEDRETDGYDAGDDFEDR